MSMQDVTVATTETGTTYELVGNFCLRTDNGYQHIMKVWTMMAGSAPYLPGESNPSWKDVSSPEVGKRLFVSGKEGWYCSTPVVSVVHERKEYPIS